MIFDDLFYPGNPARRQEVASLRADITSNFKKFHDAWNATASLLNGIFAGQEAGGAYSGVQLLLIEKSIDKDPAGECVKEINNVIADARLKLNKLVEDIGLAGYLPEGWEDNGCTVNEIGADKMREIGKWAGFAGDSAASTFAVWYAFKGTLTMKLTSKVVSALASAIGTGPAGLIAGAVIGAAAFVITDAIASAITGAIERKQLKSAIESLTALKAEVSPLENASVNLAAIKQNITDGYYKLDDTHEIRKKPDGSYVIVDTSKLVASGKNVLAAAPIDDDAVILLFPA